MNEQESYKLAVLRSDPVKIITFTICAIILLLIGRKFLKEFVACQSVCKVTDVAEKVVDTTGRIAEQRRTNR